MTKIVYNSCYGGFGLSEDATRRYAELIGAEVEVHNEFATPIRFFLIVKDGKQIYEDQISRTDPALVQVVEELGENASGSYARLCVAEVPTGTRYRIDEYDGFETIMTIDDYDWQVT